MPAETERVMRALVQGTERLLQKLALDINANLIERSRVDTGFFRANWIASVGQEPPAILVEGSSPSPTEVGAAAGFQAAGQAELLSYRLTRGPIFIVNNARYAQALEVRFPIVDDAINSAIAGLPRVIR